MALATTDLEEATNEAAVYNRMGGLTEGVLIDIAHNWKVDYRDILEELGWGRDYYD